MGMYPGGNIVRVTPTLSTDAYAQNDVLFNPTEVKNAVSNRGGVSRLINAYILDQSDVADSDIYIILTTGSTVLGSLNATANISAANWKTNKPLGFFKIDADQAGTEENIDNVRFFGPLPSSGINESAFAPFLLKAAENSTSVYVHGVLYSNTTPTYDADSFELIFHVEYL